MWADAYLEALLQAAQVVSVGWGWGAGDQPATLNNNKDNHQGRAVGMSMRGKHEKARWTWSCVHGGRVCVCPIAEGGKGGQCDWYVPLPVAWRRRR